MPSSASSNWPSRAEWALIVGAWTTVALLTAVNGVLAPHGGGSVKWGRFPVELGREMFEYGFWIVITPAVFWFARTMPVDRGHAARNVTVHLGVAAAVAFGLDVTDAFLRTLLFPDPARTAEFDPMRIVTNLWFVNELVVYLVVLAAGVARDNYLQKKERQAETERLQERTAVLEQRLTEARLEALRMQLNPHFLFNTLHAVSTLVGRDPQGVRRMIARLSELLRRVLDEDAPQELPLSDELDVLDDYLEIQQIRFQGRLDVSVDVPDALGTARVPYLILQPLAENAVKHGASRVRGTGRIAITARRDTNDDAGEDDDEGDTLVVTVRDNGPGFDGDSFSPGVGLRNVAERLHELYGDAAGLDVRPASGGPGVEAVLRLPYHTGGDRYVPSDPPAARDDRDGEPPGSESSSPLADPPADDDTLLTTTAADRD